MNEEEKLRRAMQSRIEDTKKNYDPYSYPPTAIGSLPRTGLTYGGQTSTASSDNTEIHRIRTNLLEHKKEFNKELKEVREELEELRKANDVIMKLLTEVLGK